LACYYGKPPQTARTTGRGVDKMNKNELIVDRNLSVRIQELYQYPTYSGLLEGLPHDKYNQRIIEGAKEDAMRVMKLSAIHLINPIQTPIPYEGKYPFGTPMSLPSMCCMANLIYKGNSLKNPKNTEDWFFAGLTVIWFQDGFAFPIASDILTQIKDIPFRKLCVETEF